MENTTTEKPIESMLDMSDVCKVLKISRPTFLKLVTGGGLRARKIGRKWKVQPKDIRLFMDSAPAHGE